MVVDFTLWILPVQKLPGLKNTDLLTSFDTQSLTYLSWDAPPLSNGGKPLLKIQSSWWWLLLGGGASQPLSIHPIMQEEAKSETSKRNAQTISIQSKLWIFLHMCCKQNP